jgi:predicted transcriptional regulator
MPESTFTIRVDDHLKEAFSEAARANDRTGAQLVRGFMRDYVQIAREKAEYEEWFKARVEAGLRAVQDGRVLSDDEVRKRSRLRRERLIEAHGARSR